MLYREVGIVIGDDPHKYKGAPLAVKKNRIDRKRRGDMPRDESSIRAFIPFTQDIVLQSRYCVGVKPTDGYLHPRVIDSDCIFFYPEFWEGCNETNKKDRRVFMNTRMKQLTTIAQTAIVQTSSEPTRAPGAVDGLTESTTSNPSAVTQADGLVNKHILQYTLFDDPGRHGITRRMLEGIDTTAPDRDHGTTNGIKRFLDFDVDLSEQDAEHVKRELKDAIPAMLDLPLNIIHGIHRVMKEQQPGIRLPRSDLVFFLAVCNASLLPDEVDDEAIWREVDHALEVVKLRDICKTGPTTSNVEPINYHLLLGCIKDTIDQLVSYVKQPDQQADDQQSGTLKHTSKELMSKIGKTVQVANLQSLFEKLLHAVQHTPTNDELDKLAQVSEQIGNVLAVRDQ